MDMDKFLVLVLYVVAWKLQYVENVCNDYIERAGPERHMCNHYRCGYYQSVIAKTITCNNISIDDLPEGEDNNDFYAPHFSTTLKVIDSDIPELPTGAFRSLANLTVLIMKNTKLKKIMPAAFNYLHKLREMSLRQNELTTISDGVFNTLNALQTLDLSMNSIETITDHAFVGVYLNNLNLRNNNISNFSEVLVNSFRKLSTLDLSHNNLENINNFHTLSSLLSLDVSYNSLEAVDFEVLQNASLVDVSFNNITEIINFNLSKASNLILNHNRISNLGENHQVQVLDIRYNNLETIGSNLFSEILLQFYASFNSISSVNIDAFFGLRQLTHLYLDNNNLTSIPTSCFKDLESLTHLNLSGNKLSSFKFGTFDKMLYLEVLDISNNEFKELPQYSFHSLNKLTQLLFQNNEVSDVNIDELLKHLKVLREINFNNNVWSCQKLVNIVHTLKSKNINFVNGNMWEDNNIHGIKCYETSQNLGIIKNSSDISLDLSKLNSFFNEDFTKTLLYKYFNQDFKETEFFKYLENMRKSNNPSYNKNADNDVLEKLLNEIKSNLKKYNEDSTTSQKMYNYFNKDFKNSSFFQYMESFKKLKSNATETIDEKKIEGLTKTFQNLAKDLEINANATKLYINLEKSYMYNKFNKDLNSSNFYRLLESLNAMNTDAKVSTLNGSQTEKLVSPYEKLTEYPNYTGLLSVIAIFLFIITCVMITVAYHQIFYLKRHMSAREEVELISSS